MAQRILIINDEEHSRRMVRDAPRTRLLTAIVAEDGFKKQTVVNPRQGYSEATRSSYRASIGATIKCVRTRVFKKGVKHPSNI